MKTKIYFIIIVIILVPGVIFFQDDVFAAFIPVEFTQIEKDSLSKVFKEFFQESAKRYFTHDLRKPLKAVESLYVDIVSGNVPYQGVLARIDQALVSVKNSPFISDRGMAYNVLFEAKGKILAPKLGAVFGMWSLDGLSLLPEDSVLRHFEVETGQKVRLDNLVLELQDVDGNLRFPDDPFMIPIPGKSNNLKIGPSFEILLLRTWASGAIPAIELHLQEHNSVSWQKEAFGRVIPDDKWISLQDIIDGDIDDYFSQLAGMLKKYNMPVFLRVINEFNAYMIIWPDFGKDGRTSIFDLCGRGGGRDRFFKAIRENDMAVIDGFRFDCPGLFTGYGDPNLPDGPERIRDAWRHIHDVFDEAQASNVTWAAQIAPEHGSHIRIFEKVREIDKMEYYWPGRNYLDWGGISGYVRDLEKNKNKPGTLFSCVGWWKEEITDQEWGELPNVLYEFSQVPRLQKENFLQWIRDLMSEYLPADFPNIKAINWIEKNMPLETKEEVDAFRKYVTNNSYWQGEFRYSGDIRPAQKINDLKAELKDGGILLSWSAPVGDANLVKAGHYIIKYRNNRFTNGIDFMLEPWRLWSDYDTLILDGPPSPLFVGSKQSKLVVGLKPGVYYFGIQSIGDKFYNSQISNIVEAEIR